MVAVQALSDLDAARMNLQVYSSWGTHALQLKLPAGSVRFTGLSAAQYASLEKNYQCFVPEIPHSADQHGIECRAYRLERPPVISVQVLTVDGQYATRNIREPDGVNVTGLNFQAKIRIGKSRSPATLGVAEEHELAQSDVIENFLRIYTAHKALELGGVVLHSAGLVFESEAYIFPGYSNAGKTTLTRKAYEKGAWVLSDDINLVLPGECGYQAHAVPFTGEFGRTLDHQGGQDSYPVAGVVLLEQGDCLKTEPVTASQAVARLLTGCPFVNTDAEESSALFDSVTSLVAEVPVIRLVSRRDDSIEEIMEAVKSELKSAGMSNSVTKRKP